jgi:D-alanyl-D-alanine endopeptidase (penicillin-binding protein 7)
MIKSALVAFFSVFFLVALALPAHAEFTSSTSVKKRTVKKAVASKAAKTRVIRSKKATSIKAKRTKATAAKRGPRAKARMVAVKKKAYKSAALKTRGKTVRQVIVKNGKRRVIYKRVPARVAPVLPPALSAGDIAGLRLTHDPLQLASNVAMVIDQTSSRILFEKNAHVALPIASITKLMTGLVVVESRQNMDELLDVSEEDVDREKHSGSRLRLGSQLSRDNMLRIALMSSENRAASSLGRHYPGGLPAFVVAMNAKAKSLGMINTRFVDPTGLSSQNVASAHDLTRLVLAAYKHPVLGQYSTGGRYVVHPGPYTVQYANSNQLVTNPEWEIGLQKTGYISEAGRCLAMQAKIEGRPVIMVFLDSKGRYSRLADAGRVRTWLSTLPSSTTPDRQVAAASPGA